MLQTPLFKPMKRARKALGSKAHSELRSLLESGAYEVVPEGDPRGQDQTFVKFKKRARKAPFKQLGTIFFILYGTVETQTIFFIATALARTLTASAG